MRRLATTGLSRRRAGDQDHDHADLVDPLRPSSSTARAGVGRVIQMASWPAPPGAPPPLGQLMAGFATLAGGIAILTRRREHRPLRSAAGTRRVLLYILAYSLTSLSFMRVLAPAILVRESSP